MSDLTKQQFKDLTKLARDRARDSVLSVTQLTDDIEAAAMLISVSADLLEGAVAFVQHHDKDIDEDEAFSAVLRMLFRNLGYGRTIDALSRLKQREASK